MRESSEFLVSYVHSC